MVTVIVDYRARTGCQAIVDKHGCDCRDAKESKLDLGKIKYVREGLISQNDAGCIVIVSGKV